MVATKMAAPRLFTPLLFCAQLFTVLITLRVVEPNSLINICDHLQQFEVPNTNTTCIRDCCYNRLCEGVLTESNASNCIHIFCESNTCWFHDALLNEPVEQSHIWLKRRIKRDTKAAVSGLIKHEAVDNAMQVANDSICGNQTCGVNEKCTPSVNGSDVSCVCVDGYKRNENWTCVRSGVSIPSLAQQLPNTLAFEVVGPSTVQLPQDTVQLKIVHNRTEEYSNLTYYWEVLDGSGFGTAKTYTEQTLTLLDLKEGTIRLRATISNQTNRGYRDVVITILPEKKPNQAPKAVIRPASPVIASEGSKVVLDAEGSSDDQDVNQLEFEWKLLNGPTISLPAMNAPILRLDNLVVGKYTFGLTVKDKQGATGHGTVDVIVSPKRDDPPKAQITECGETESRATIDVRLPRKTLLLCANTSTDDYGITSYNWFRIDNLTAQLPVDYSGSSTAVLTLTDLKANQKLGPYVFRLEVEDASHQVDKTTVNILVNKAVNSPPQPSAGANQTLQLPVNSAVLNGNVKDDGEIVNYYWSQISGPSQVSFVNQDKSKCTVSGFMEGLYQFRLNVTDDGGLSATDDTFVNVTRSKNDPPVAIVRNVTVYLPSNFAVLNGSESKDDAGIVSYLWTPHDDVPACIVFLGDSRRQAVAMLEGLIPGEFLFDLTVEDHPKASDTATAVLTVIAGDEHLNSIEMFMDQDSSDITYRLRNKLKGRLSTALASQIADANTVDIHFSDFAQDPTSGRLRVVFHAEYPPSAANEVVSRQVTVARKLKVVEGSLAAKILRSEANMISEYHISSIDTLYCLRDCSGHGTCNNFSKECDCDRYWMPNLLHYAFSRKKLDCAWSSLYFGIFVFFIAIFFISCIAVRCTYNGHFRLSNWSDSKSVTTRRRRRRRYRRNDEDLPRSCVQNGNIKKNELSTSYSLLLGSDSLSSDSEAERVAKIAAAKLAGREQQGVELRERNNSTLFIE